MEIETYQPVEGEISARDSRNGIVVEFGTRLTATLDESEAEQLVREVAMALRARKRTRTHWAALAQKETAVLAGTTQGLA